MGHRRTLLILESFILLQGERERERESLSKLPATHKSESTVRLHRSSERRRGIEDRCVVGVWPTYMIRLNTSWWKYI